MALNKLSTPPLSNPIQDLNGFIDVAWGRWTQEVYNTIRANDTSKLSSITIANHASLELTKGISGSYKSYIIELIDVIPETSGDQLMLRVSSDTGTTYQNSLANYSWLYKLLDVTGTTVNESNVGNASDVQIKLSGADLNNTSIVSISGTVEIYNPANTTVYKSLKSELIYTDNTDRLQIIKAYGRINNIDAIDAIKFYLTSGHFISGTISLYGRI